MGYKPIESYGVIGDLHTVALVGIDGSIDWCCLPHFDSPSVFAAILDDQKGGSFRIASLYEAQHKQMYMPDSNVLVTRFLSDQGVGEVVDFMPVQGPREIRKIHQIVRVVRVVRGSVRFRLDCWPAFDFARRPHQVVLEGRVAIFEAQGMKVSLVSRFPLSRQGDGVAAELLQTLAEQAGRAFEVESVIAADVDVELAGEFRAEHFPIAFELEVDVVRFPGAGDRRVDRAGLAVPQPGGLAVGATRAKDRFERAELPAMPHDLLHVREGSVEDHGRLIPAGERPRRRPARQITCGRCAGRGLSWDR